jgi:hypothetical protein
LLHPARIGAGAGIVTPLTPNADLQAELSHPSDPASPSYFVGVVDLKRFGIFAVGSLRIENLSCRPSLPSEFSVTAS